MQENQSNRPTSVDRRQETVVTQEPGYAATEQTTRDVAAEQRLRVFQVTRIIWTVLSMLEIVLLARFVLKLLGANPNSGFAVFVYGVSGLFAAPFAGLFPISAAGGSLLETTTIIAMIIYALLFWGVVRLIPIITDRSTVRSVTRTTREQTPGSPGNVRTTNSTTKE